jgi:superfamily II DNA/RNA helicase
VLLFQTRGILTCAVRVDLVAKAIRGTISRNAVITDTIQPISVPTASDISPAADAEVSADDIVSDSVLESVLPVKEQVQTMVFVNTAKGAIALAAALRKVGVVCSEYHTGIPDPQRQENLRGFRVQEVSVLVCTDHASRGLDLPHVRHVIQAEFATNVVQYLHRVGRASRAGVLGRATNIYDSGSEVLIASILNDSDENKIDQSFSRRRSFRKKLKKSLKGDDGSDDDGETETTVSDPLIPDLTTDVFIK